jgi:hypothetical protein
MTTLMEDSAAEAPLRLGVVIRSAEDADTAADVASTGLGIDTALNEFATAADVATRNDSAVRRTSDPATAFDAPSWR